MGGVAGSVVHLLEDPWDGRHGRGPVHLEFVDQVGDVRREPDRDVGLRPEQSVALGECVGEREEQQPGVAGAQLRAERVERLGDVCAQVAVGEHASLRTSRRAGGVDDRGDRVDIEVGDPLIDHGVVDLHGSGLELVECPGIDGQHVAAHREVGAKRLDDIGHLGRLDDGHHRLAVTHDPADLIRRRRVVDRHGHRARRKDRIVEDHPFETGV